MANSEGKGEANDAGVATQQAFEEGSQEDHDAAIAAKLREEADALLKSAETAVEKTKAQLADAEQGLKEAKAHRAELGDK